MYEYYTIQYECEYSTSMIDSKEQTVFLFPRRLKLPDLIVRMLSF